MNLKSFTSKTTRAMALVALLIAGLMSSAISPTAANAVGTWTMQASAGEAIWTSIASSADGTKLAAVSSYTVSGKGSIITSTDSGVTWTEQTNAGKADWTSIASSGDGTKLVAAQNVDSSNNLGSIYTSSDSGVTWNKQTSAGTNHWKSVTSSADGTKLAAAAYMDSIYGPAGIYTSADSGATWTQQTSAGTQFWKSIASSADGTKLAAVSIYRDSSYNQGTVLTSSDSGVTWTEQTNAGYAGWASIASSADGTKLAAVQYVDNTYNAGSVFTSADSGVSWTKQTAAGATYWAAIASSADGSKLAVTSECDSSCQPGAILTSADSGATWTEQTGAGRYFWASIASSADGSKLAAVSYADALYNPGNVWTYSGVVPTPVFSASTPSVPNTYVGSFSAVQTETVTNTGDGDLVFGAGAVTVAGANGSDYTIVADNCSSQTVAPAGTCTVTYQFKSLVAGTRTANLVFASNAVSSPDTVSLSALAMGVVTIRKIDDASGPARGGTNVEIYGTGFNAGATVTFGGVTATVTKRTGSTKILVRTPSHAVGKVLVVVTNPDTGNASYNGFTYKR